MDLVLESKFVSPSGVKEGQIGIEDGKIKFIKKSGLEGKKLKTRGLIFPGFIDMHVHLREPGWIHKEDFRTGSKAALHGGVTTVVDMPNNKPPINNLRALKRKIRLAKKKALIDILFYGMVDDNLKELVKMKSLVAGYKVYMSETTGTRGVDAESLEKILGKIPKKLVSFHCEDRHMIEQDMSRPEVAETKAITEVTKLSRKFSIKSNICHISTKSGFSIANKARLFREVSPLHAFFFKKNAEKNRKLTMNPPLRTREDRDFLFRSLISGKASFLATDHAPHTIEEKKEGARGCPGLDTYGGFVSLLLKKGASPETINRITSLNASHVLGLKKGLIKEGFEADFSIIEMNPWKVSRKELETQCGWSPFEGFVFPGRASISLRKGEPAWENV